MDQKLLFLKKRRLGGNNSEFRYETIHANTDSRILAKWKSVKRPDQNDVFLCGILYRKGLVFCPFLRGPWSEFAENFISRPTIFRFPIHLLRFVQVHTVFGKIYAKVSFRVITILA